MDRQKVFIILGVAWVSAALLSWFVYSRSRSPKRANTVRVMAAVRDLPVGTRLRKTDLKTVEAPEQDLPRGAFLSDKEILDRALVYPVGANEPITPLKLARQSGSEGVPATIEPGKRAMSVQITDVSGVAGLIQPGSRVDVLFTRTGNMAEAVTTTVLQNIQVLAIGRIFQVGQQVDPKAPKMPVATLIVTPEEAQKLELAKNQGRISLALRNPLDQQTDADVQPVTAEAIDPAIIDRASKARRRLSPGSGRAVPNLDDPAVWKQLTSGELAEGESGRAAALARQKNRKKEEDKPKLVVDVFRGDKHVQETFK